MSPQLGLQQDRFERPVQTVEHCDLCGSKEHLPVAEDGPSRCRIVMCENCGLLFASPSFAVSALEGFYDDGFIGDPGSNKRVGGGGIEPRKLREEERIAKNYSLPVIRRHMDVAGRRILDIRSRSGALAELLARDGAEVIAIDPMESNAQHARSRDGVREARFVPALELSELSEFADGSFDAVSALTIHTLGHLPSPRRFLARIYDLLKPGGYLFVDEKDVLHPVHATGPSVFDSGAPHYFHFTQETLQKYFEVAGFDVLECSIDPDRKKAMRHVPVVARKPNRPSRRGFEQAELAADTEKLLDDLARAEQSLRRRQTFNQIRRCAKRGIRKLLN